MSDLNYGLAWRLETDDPDVLNDVDDIRSGFKFRSYEEDFDFAVSDLDRPVFNMAGSVATPYTVARYLVMEAYYARGYLEPLALIFSKHHWPVSGFIHEFVQHAEANNRPELAARVWTGVALETKRRFLAALPDRERHGEIKGVKEEIAALKENALAAYDTLIAFHHEQGQMEDKGRLKAERDRLAREDFQKPLKPPLPRQMDTETFWALLEDNKATHEPGTDAGTNLMFRLEAYAASDIQKFYQIYARTMKQLYHWNVWALAYAARGGCSDASFHDFRAWIILQGDPALVTSAIEAPAQAAKQVPHNPHMKEGGLTGCIEAAYLARSGLFLKPLLTETARPKGREWDEDALESTYPELMAVYKGQT